ncbi:MAG TPA: glycerophosphoryl diester phosphodiesterase membrane domain-containing protein [Sphingobacteriaceae bacterium]|nr:glycerophosphoryl diester phosphodiesterase membrane domain-containing protein [Sphingobacteriaceae bacterium]
MNKPFSVNEVIADAWIIAKKNIWIILGFTAIYFVTMFVISSILSILLGESTTSMALLQNVLINLADAFISVAMYQVFFKLIDDEGNPEFPDFVPNLMKAFNFVMVKLIIGLVAVVLIAIIAAVYFMNSPEIEIDSTNPFNWKLLPVFILIAIPLIYFTIRLCFSLCFIVDQESGATESISQSWTLTSGNFWFLLWLFVVILGINILGAIALFVGLFFTFPFSILMIIIAYRHMVNNYADEEEVLIEDNA